MIGALFQCQYFREAGMNCQQRMRVPEMNSLEANRTIPHPLEPTLLCGLRSGTLPSPASELCSR